MTQEILKRVAKAKKVNLDWYDHMIAYINENYTKVFITFANLEVVGGSRFFCNKKPSPCLLQPSKRGRRQSGNTPPRDGKDLNPSDK